MFLIYLVNLGTNAKSAAENLISNWVWSVLSFLSPHCKTPRTDTGCGVFLSKSPNYLSRLVRLRLSASSFILANTSASGRPLRFLPSRRRTVTVFSCASLAPITNV